MASVSSTAFATPGSLLLRGQWCCGHVSVSARRASLVAPQLQPVVAPRFARVSAMAPRPRGNSSKRRFDPKKAAAALPKKVKLEPETVFYEGRTSWTELIIPTLSLLTVVGIIPFSAAVARFLWVRYKFTSRRISVDSGFGGKDHVEIVYRDIANVKYVRRSGGSSGDIVLELKDGAKLELRAVPKFGEIYDYILNKIDDEARAASGSAFAKPATSET